MRNQLNEAVRPYAVFDIVPSDRFFEGIIRNTGVTAAHCVRVALDPRLEVELGGAMRPLNLLSKEIALLAHGRSIDEYFGHFKDVERQNNALTFSGAVCYSDVNGQTYTDKFRIDLSFGKEHGSVAKADIGEELKKLNEQLGPVVTLLSRK